MDGVLSFRVIAWREGCQRETERPGGRGEKRYEVAIMLITLH